MSESNLFIGKKIESLREKFINESGFRENLFRQRMVRKKKKS